MDNDRDKVISPETETSAERQSQRCHTTANPTKEDVKVNDKAHEMQRETESQRGDRETEKSRHRQGTERLRNRGAKRHPRDKETGHML